MTASRVRALYPWHSWLGVMTGLLIFVLCVSGSMAVFKDELDAWVAASADQAGARPDVDRALALFRGAVDGPAAIRRLELPAAGRGYTVRTTDGRRFRLDALEQVRPVRETHGLADFLVNYHTRFFLGHEGRWLIGLVGLSLLASLITGLLIHRRLLSALFVQRWRHSVRLAQSDTHKTIGVWGLPFHVIIALTGFWLGLNSLLIPAGEWLGDVFGGAAEAEGHDMSVESIAVSGPSPSTLIEYTRREIAGFEPIFIDFRHPGREQERIEIRGNLPGRLVRRHEVGAVFDAGTGRLIALDDPGRMAVARRLDWAMAPLHFGDYGGIVLRWLYALLGVFGALLALTGTFMWISRHSRQGVPAYRRVVVLVAGGCVVATAALPLLALLAAVGIGPSFSGNMRLTALFSGEVAPALPAFLLVWLVSGSLLACYRSTGLSAAVALVVGGLIWLLSPVIAVLLRTAHGLPVLDAQPGVAIGLAACGAMLVVSGCRLGRVIRRRYAGTGSGRGRAWPAAS